MEVLAESNHSQASEPVRSPNRMRYEAEVTVIKHQIGELETIRKKLGLSARKICQLLLVDPSAWTRWTTGITPPPPHIFRSLQWYLMLQDHVPGLNSGYFLGRSIISERSIQMLEKQGPQISSQHQEIIKLNESILNLEVRLQKKEEFIRRLALSAILLASATGLLGALLILK